jgi:GH25 family lysozyme M1 (1,4-beta-N-acetylmuramidase)
MKMTDYNPNSRERGEFFYPVPSNRLLNRIENYLISVLAQPGWIRGPDGSHWNDRIRWQEVKDSGCDFAIIKCTEGTGFLDPMWETNWRAALDVGLVVMPYHFFRGNYKGADQVSWFMQNAESFLDQIEGKTCLWWDVETEDGVDIVTRQNRLHGACVHTVKRGLQAGYYSSPYKWQTLIGNPVWANDYWQWVAHWSNVAYPTLPVGWTKERTRVWQNGIYPTYSWVEPIEGAGTVDHNYFFGTRQELIDWLGFAPPLPPDCCDEIEQIKSELIVIKSRIAQGELNDIEHENRLDATEVGIISLSERISKIETYIDNITNVPWK